MGYNFLTLVTNSDLCVKDVSNTLTNSQEEIEFYIDLPTQSSQTTQLNKFYWNFSLYEINTKRAGKIKMKWFLIALFLFYNNFDLIRMIIKSMKNSYQNRIIKNVFSYSHISSLKVLLHL